MAKLKPCPFCGAEAKIVFTIEDKKGCKYGYIRCGKDYPNCCVIQTNEIPLEDAIEAWNGRMDGFKYQS